MSHIIDIYSQVCTVGSFCIFLWINVSYVPMSRGWRKNHTLNRQISACFCLIFLSCLWILNSLNSDWFRLFKVFTSVMCGFCSSKWFFCNGFFNLHHFHMAFFPFFTDKWLTKELFTQLYPRFSTAHLFIWETVCSGEDSVMYQAKTTDKWPYKVNVWRRRVAISGAGMLTGWKCRIFVTRGDHFNPSDWLQMWIDSHPPLCS